ncbi:MAG: TerB family tellurite resistance protein [SAR324 cluster bacterium]|nr:TerB family tellurite resistance protein [SAR324 cluster bacterium]
MQLPDVEAMSAAEKIWFAKSIAGMVVADGRADQQEMNFLREAINFLENKDDIQAIMDIIKECKSPEMSLLEIEPKQAFLMLKFLAQLMVADSHLHSKEIAYFLLAGRYLGFNNEILTKLWKSARAMLDRDLPLGIIETGKITAKVRLTKVDGDGFTFRLGKALMPKVSIMLKVRKEIPENQGSEEEEKYWDVISCKMFKQRQLKFEESCYLVRAVFVQKIAEEHGIMQIMHPEKFAKFSDGGFIKTKKNSLLGSNLRCYVCDNPEVAFFELHSKSMITEPNIFGIPAYIRSAGKLDFCDYNLIQVASCAKCGFSSNHKEHFKRLKTDKAVFDVTKFSTGWEEKIAPLLKKSQAAGEEFYSEERNTKQGILAYDLAIATFEQMSSIVSDDQQKGMALRKEASMLMTQAELLMENKDREAAEANLKKVVEKLEPIFERLKGPEMIHVCLLLFQIKIYLNELQSAAQYMKFMDNYDPENKLEEGTEEYKELKVGSAKLKATFDDREILTKEKLTRFHLDDE